MKIDEKVNINVLANRQESKSLHTYEKTQTLPNVQIKQAIKIP